MSTKQERSATLPKAKPAARGCGTGRLHLCTHSVQERALRVKDGGAA